MIKAESHSARKPHFQSDGVHHATINGHRFHLIPGVTDHHRLLIDAKPPMLILDDTAYNFVRFLIDAMWMYQRGEGDESASVINYVVDQMFSKYGQPKKLRRKPVVTRAMIHTDLDKIWAALMAIADGGKCPHELGIGPTQIKFGTWTAPARMDIAVTPECNLLCEKCYRDDQPISQMTLSEWCQVYEILWKIGIPQIVITGGEPTLRDDIVELVANAEEFVIGLVTNGTQLERLAEALAEASLDYTQITIESLNPVTHDCMTGITGSWEMTRNGILAAKNVGIQVATNTTLTKRNRHEFNDTIAWLADQGIQHIACNTLICSGRGKDCREKSGISDEELKPILETAMKMAQTKGVELAWYSPTCYTQLNPLELGFGVKCCTAALLNMTIEANGDVRPCQSWPESVGNILKDEWSIIWNNPVCQDLRSHSEMKRTCAGCTYWRECGGGCPLDDTPRVCTGEEKR